MAENQIPLLPLEAAVLSTGEPAYLFLKVVSRLSIEATSSVTCKRQNVTILKVMYGLGLYKYSVLKWFVTSSMLRNCTVDCFILFSRPR